TDARFVRRVEPDLPVQATDFQEFCGELVGIALLAVGARAPIAVVDLHDDHGMPPPLDWVDARSVAQDGRPHQLAIGRAWMHEPCFSITPQWRGSSNDDTRGWRRLGRRVAAG